MERVGMFFPFLVVCCKYLKSVDISSQGVIPHILVASQRLRHRLSVQDFGNEKFLLILEKYSIKTLRHNIYFVHHLSH